MTPVRSPNRPADPFAQLSLSYVPVLDHLAEALRRRRIRRSYGRMSETALRDIGLTPFDVTSALALPLTRNASDALAQVASGPRSKW